MITIIRITRKTIEKINDEFYLKKKKKERKNAK
jgi:hypothetical protein